MQTDTTFGSGNIYIIFHLITAFIIFRFFKKTSYTEAEEVKIAEVRKAIKEKCDKFMEMVQKKYFVGGGTFGELWTTKIENRRPLLVMKIYKNERITDSTLIEATQLARSNTNYFPKLIYSGHNSDGNWCTIMQFFTGGTLDFHIEAEIKRRKEKKGFKITPAQKKYIAYHLARAIEYLHSLLWTHGYIYFNFIF